MSDLFGFVKPVYLYGSTAKARNDRFGVVSSRPERKFRTGEVAISGGVGPVGPVRTVAFVDPTFGRSDDTVKSVRTVAQLDRATIGAIPGYTVYRDGNAPGINDLHRKKGSAIAGPATPGRAAVEGLGEPTDGNPGYLACERKWLPKTKLQGLDADQVVTRRLNLNWKDEPKVGKCYRQTVKGSARG